jgi:hypothetical protein
MSLLRPVRVTPTPLLKYLDLAILAQPYRLVDGTVITKGLVFGVELLERYHALRR